MDTTLDQNLQNQQDSSAVLSYLALGDSYTIGESVSEGERWPVQLQQRINDFHGGTMKDPEIIARTGWRTDELIEAIERADPSNDYGLVSLLIGVNNQYQKRDTSIYRSEFRTLLETAIEKAAGIPAHVLVLSIPDYGYTPFGAANRETISRELDVYNEINHSISEEYGVMYVDITGISRDEDPGLVADDRLHPSGEQYRRWVARIIEDPAFKTTYLTD